MLKLATRGGRQGSGQTPGGTSSPPENNGQICLPFVTLPLTDLGGIWVSIFTKTWVRPEPHTCVALIPMNVMCLTGRWGVLARRSVTAKKVDVTRGSQMHLPCFGRVHSQFLFLSEVKKLEQLYISKALSLQIAYKPNGEGEERVCVGLFSFLWTLPEKGSCICKLRVTCTFCGYGAFC